MTSTIGGHWAEDKHTAHWEIHYDTDGKPYRSYYVTCMDGGIVMRTTSNEWRCTLCLVRMNMVFSPRQYSDPEDIPLVRRDGDPRLVGFNDEIRQN